MKKTTVNCFDPTMGYTRAVEVEGWEIEPGWVVHRTVGYSDFQGCPSWTVTHAATGRVLLRHSSTREHAIKAFWLSVSHGVVAKLELEEDAWKTPTVEGKEMETTLNEILSFGPCESRWDHLLENLAPLPGDDEPIPLVRVLEVNGVKDALWLLREKRELRLIVRFTCDYAERVVERYWKPEHPDDRRPQEAIEAAREWADDPTDENRQKAYAATRAAFTAASDALTTVTPTTTRAAFAADAAYYAARVYADFGGYTADGTSLDAYDAVRRAFDTIDADSADKRDLAWRAEHLREMLSE